MLHWFGLKIFGHYQDILKRVGTCLKMKIALRHYGLWKDWFQPCLHSFLNNSKMAVNFSTDQKGDFWKSCENHWRHQFLLPGLLGGHLRHLTTEMCVTSDKDCCRVAQILAEWPPPIGSDHPIRPCPETFWGVCFISLVMVFPLLTQTMKFSSFQKFYKCNVW